MKDEGKQKKKEDGVELGVAKILATSAKISIDGLTKNNSLLNSILNPKLTRVGTESLLGLDHNAHIFTGTEIIKNNFGASTIDRIGTISIPPNTVPLSVGTQPDGLIVKASALKNYDLGAIGPIGPIGYNAEQTENMFSFGNRASLGESAFAFATGPTGPRQLTTEEINALIEKRLSLNKGEITKKEDVFSLIKEYTEATHKQEEGAIKKGLEIITKKLLNGGKEEWRCKRCTAPLDVFEGETSIEKIRKYLSDFRNNILKKCKNGHQNFFEIREDGMIWSVKTSFDNDFRFSPKKIDNN